MTSKLRVAVVHDWLTGMRGGEVVLEGILSLYPEADLFTLLHNPGSVSKFIENRKIKTSFIDGLPLKRSRYRNYLLFFPAAIETFDFREYDLVISSSHCVAKGVICPPGTPHLCYVHSPMRYVWDMTHEYFPFERDDGRPGSFFNRRLFPFFANYLRMWDAASAHRVDSYVCNSAFVGERIRRFYGRDFVVVHLPCVEQLPARLPTERDDFFLVVSALVPYKRVDIALDAFARLGSDYRLKIAGTGPDLKRLQGIAPANVEFLGNISRADITELYSRARGLVFPGVEDFGIVPVEAQAQGCPVIAYAKGGALETVSDRTGLFFSNQTPEALADAVVRARSMKFHNRDFQKNVSRFTREIFLTKMNQEIKKLLKK